jgi:hypothetical protein
MKKIGLIAACLMTLAVNVPSLGQGESPPQIYGVDYFIVPFDGTREDLVNWYSWRAGWFWFPPMSSAVAFDPETEVAEEYDWILLQVIVVDEELSDPEAEVKFYYRLRGYASLGPPEAPPLQGATSSWPPVSDWERIDPPPDNAMVMWIWLSVPDILGVNQLRMRGLIDYDVLWWVDVRVSNEEKPEPESGQWGQFSFYLRAKENPLLAPPNPPPFADAGPDQTAAAGSTVVLDGSRSFDSSNLGFDPSEPNIFVKDTLEYAWEWISGPERVDPEADDDGNDATAQVSLSLTGDYVYRLLVEDGVNPLPSTDEVTISVVSSLPANRGPRAIITAPTAPVALGTTIRLGAERSTDPDGDKLTYRWRQTNAVGGALESDEVIDGFQPLVGVTEKIASWKPVKTGTYYFSLLVTDPGGLSDTAFTSVQVIELATAGKLLYRQADNGGDEQTPPVQERSAPGACGAGSLFALAVVPVMLWFARSRRR